MNDYDNLNAAQEAALDRAEMQAEEMRQQSREPTAATLEKAFDNLSLDINELLKRYRALKRSHTELLAALSMSRAQWFPSVNADRCLNAIKNAEELNG